MLPFEFEEKYNHKLKRVKEECNTNSNYILNTENDKKIVKKFERLNTFGNYRTCETMENNKEIKEKKTEKFLSTSKVFNFFLLILLIESITKLLKW